MGQDKVGKRLKQARELVGISQKRAADAINVTRTAITQMEAGNRSVSTLELTRLAALYRRPVMYFLADVQEDEGDDDTDVLVALHRVAPGLDDDPQVKQQVNQYIEWCREGYSLERLLGRENRSGPPAYFEPLPRNAGEAVAQGERLAEQERKRLGIGDAPIADMSDLINEQGIWASGAKFPDNMSGLFLCHPSIGQAIFVNARHVRARKRFSYAHEYAHALMDRQLKITVSSQSNASELIEKRANAFAAAFLMPNTGIEDLLDSLDKGKPSRAEKTVFDVATDGRIDTSIRPAPNSQRITYQDIALIAHHFGVSYQAATYRIRSLNHISPRECEGLLGQLAVGKEYLTVLDMFDDLEKPEDRKLWNRELRNHIVHLAIEAYRREDISKAKLLELSKSLKIPSDKMLDLAEAACN